VALLLQSNLDVLIPPRWVTVESRVNDTLARYPSTAPVFVQFGRVYVDRPQEIYPAFPGLTVGEYARHNGVALEPLLVELNAAAESEEAARLWSRSPSASPGQGVISLTLGYTASHRAAEDAAPNWVPWCRCRRHEGPNSAEPEARAARVRGHPRRGCGRTRAARAAATKRRLDPEMGADVAPDTEWRRSCSSGPQGRRR
jgi:hypothetical protein